VTVATDLRLAVDATVPSASDDEVDDEVGDTVACDSDPELWPI